MAVRYKFYKNTNSKSTTKGCYYARAISMGTVGLAEISRRIQENVSVKKSDVLAVLTELVEVMTYILQNGQKVKLDDFGTFSVGLKSKPVENIKDFNVSKHIVGSRINFLPATTWSAANGNRRQRAFLDGLEVAAYENTSSKKKESTDDTSGDD